MDLYDIFAVLCTILVSFTGTEYRAESKGVKKFHGWNGNNHGLHHLHQLHYLEDSEDLGHDLAKRHAARRPKNDTGSVLDEDVAGWTSTKNRRKREFPTRMNVKSLNESSICNYTVVPIEDRFKKFVPGNLHHIRCNHTDNTCDIKRKYCCMQTYEHISVRMGGTNGGSGPVEQMELDTGCVYATKKVPNLDEKTRNKFQRD